MQRWISRATDTFADATNIAGQRGELETEHQFKKRKYTMIRSIALSTALLTPIAAFAQEACLQHLTCRSIWLPLPRRPQSLPALRRATTSASQSLREAVRPKCFCALTTQARTLSVPAQAKRSHPPVWAVTRQVLRVLSMETLKTVDCAIWIAVWSSRLAVCPSGSVAQWSVASGSVARHPAQSTRHAPVQDLTQSVLRKPCGPSLIGAGPSARKVTSCFVPSC